MLSASISVVWTVVPSGLMIYGWPPVSARFWSKSLKPFVKVRNMQIVMDGITFGIVTFQSVCHLFAPSIFAASSISSGTACRPAI